MLGTIPVESLNSQPLDARLVFRHRQALLELDVLRCFNDRGFYPDLQTLLVRVVNKDQRSSFGRFDVAGTDVLSVAPKIRVAERTRPGEPWLHLSTTCNETLDAALPELQNLRTMRELILAAAGEGIYGLGRTVPGQLIPHDNHRDMPFPYAPGPQQVYVSETIHSSQLRRMPFTNPSITLCGA